MLQAEYRVPYLAHAPLEPMNAVVQFKDGRLDIWTGTQIPRFLVASVKPGVAQAAGGERIDVWRADGRAIAAEIGKAHVVEQHDEDVRRARRGRGRLRP